MTTTRRSSSDETATTRNLPLFLITLPRTAKSQEIFLLPRICHIFVRVVAYRAQTGLFNVITAKSFDTSGLTVGNLLVVCGAKAATCTRSAKRRETMLPFQHAAIAGWRRERKLIPSIIGVASKPKKNCKEGRLREHPNLPRAGCSQTASRQVSPSRRQSEAAQSRGNNLRQTKFR
jgi:hypothetical protein